MTKDLTKLTAVQLCRQWQNEIAFSDPEQPVFVLDEWGEIERRVRHEEELEQALAKAQQAHSALETVNKMLLFQRDEAGQHCVTLRGLLREAELLLAGGTFGEAVALKKRITAALKEGE